MASARYNENTDTWEIRAYAGKDPVTGKVHNLYKKLPGDASAQDIEDMKDALDKQAKKHKDSDVAPTVKSMFEHRLSFLEEANYSENTVSGYKSYAENYVYPDIGDMNSSDVKAITIQSLYRKLQQPVKDGGRGLSPNTIRTFHSFLKTSFQYFAEEDFIPFSPMDGVRKPRPIQTTAVALSEWDFKTILNHLIDKKKEDSSDVYTSFLLALDTGVRRGELAGLQLRDYQKMSKSLRVERSYSEKRSGYKPPKNKSSVRTIPLDDDTCSYLDEHIKRQRTALGKKGIKQTAQTPMFTMGDGSLIKPSYYTEAFGAMVKELGIDRGVHLHTLRHTHASYLLAARVDLKTVAARLGHSKETTTLSIYAHMLPGSDEAAAATFVDIRTQFRKDENE